MLNDAGFVCILRDMQLFPIAKCLSNFVVTIDLTAVDFNLGVLM